ncbi:MAG: hypothetical protein M1820_003620 [Bogoriella megaspora]|nr:MAG: hypothetical protein M1820_003620 [Bogoriella megaspora]
MALDTSVKEAYMLGHSLKESARLHVQHWMWGQRLGWQLHPQIEAPQEGLKIVDIGAGNACWLLELARNKPKTWSFCGLDNSTANFPARSYLPSNVTLQKCDVFAPLPIELHNQFDVVHIRAFCVVVKGGNPHPLTANLLQLLKPGGWIQWDEADCASFCAHSPDSQISSAKSAALIDQWQSFASKTDLHFQWLSDLPGLLHEHKLEVLDRFRLPISDDLRKPSTDIFVIGLEAMGRLAGERDGRLIGTSQSWEQLFHGLIEEVSSGVTISMDMVVALGRKQE